MKKIFITLIILAFITFPYLTFASIYGLEKNIVSKSKTLHSTVNATSNSSGTGGGHPDTEPDPDIDIEPDTDP